MCFEATPAPERPKIKVLIVDDLSQVRQSLRTVLSLAGDLEISGEAADGLAAVELAHHLAPDIILMDLAMPGLDGFCATRQIKARYPLLGVVALTLYGDADTRLQAIRAGVDAFLEKGVAVETLFETIRSVWRQCSPQQE
ncbi:MAG: response regulator transcription factor [Anaerolineae bacterium]|nr:response regulator transcription factor [Anaerolineae bacterium]